MSRPSIRADVRERFRAIVARAIERDDAERAALGTRRDQGASNFKHRLPYASRGGKATKRKYSGR
jgi:hypothetical protein